jgi:hypothetical protein
MCAQPITRISDFTRREWVVALLWTKHAQDYLYRPPKPAYFLLWSPRCEVQRGDVDPCRSGRHHCQQHGSLRPRRRLYLHRFIQTRTRTSNTTYHGESESITRACVLHDMCAKLFITLKAHGPPPSKRRGLSLQPRVHRSIAHRTKVHTCVCHFNLLAYSFCVCAPADASDGPRILFLHSARRLMELGFVILLLCSWNFVPICTDSLSNILRYGTVLCFFFSYGKCFVRQLMKNDVHAPFNRHSPSFHAATSAAEGSARESSGRCG